METVYVLKGYEGDYDDYHEWLVRAYADKDAADTACAKANDEAVAFKRAWDKAKPWNKPLVKRMEFEERLRGEYLTIDHDAAIGASPSAYVVVDLEFQSAP